MSESDDLAEASQSISEPQSQGVPGASASSSSFLVDAARVTEDELDDLETHVLQHTEAAETNVEIVTSPRRLEPRFIEPKKSVSIGAGHHVINDEPTSPHVKHGKQGGSIFHARPSRDDLSQDFALNLLPNMHAEQMKKEREKQREQQEKSNQKNAERRTSDVSAMGAVFHGRRAHRASTVAGITGGEQRRERSCSFALNSVSAHSTINQIASMAASMTRGVRPSSMEPRIKPESDEDDVGKPAGRRERTHSFALNSVSNHSTIQAIQQLVPNSPSASGSGSQRPSKGHGDHGGRPMLDRKPTQELDHSDSSDESSSEEEDAPVAGHVRSVRYAGDDNGTVTSGTLSATPSSNGGDIIRRLSRLFPFAAVSTGQQQVDTIAEEDPEASQEPHKPKRRFSRAINAETAEIARNAHDEGDEGHLPWIFTSQANTFFGCLILVNAGYIGAETDHYERLPEDFWLISESIFLVAFGIELILRWVHHKKMPMGIDEEAAPFFMHVWNVLDLLIVVAGILDTWVMTILIRRILGEENLSTGQLFGALQLFRILRLLRIIRIFRFLKELLLLAQGIYAAMKGLVWAIMLLVMTLYICSIISTRFIGTFSEDEPLPDGAAEMKMWFGSVHASLFTLFQLTTLESWPDITRHCMKVKGWYAGIFFIFFVLFTNLVLLNLVTGVILENVMAISRREEEKALQREEAVRVQTVFKIHRLFDAVLGDLHSGELSIEEFRQACLNPRVVRQLQDLQIATHEAEELFVLMDTSKRGCIDIDHFIEGCLRIRGVARAKHLLGVQYDVQKVWSKLSEQIDECEDRLMEVLECIMEEVEDFTRLTEDMRGSFRGSQIAVKRASADNNVSRSSARGRTSHQKQDRSSLRNSSTNNKSSADLGGSPGNTLTAVTAVTPSAATPSANNAARTSAEVDFTVVDSATTVAEESQEVSRLSHNMGIRGSSKKRHLSHKLSSAEGLPTLPISGNAVEIPEVGEGSGEKRSSEAGMKSAASKKRAFVKRGNSKSLTQGDLSNTLDLIENSELYSSVGSAAVTEKAHAERAVARLVELQREEDRLQRRLDKVKQAREVELLWLQRYLSQSDGAPGGNLRNTLKSVPAGSEMESEKDTTWAHARSMPDKDVNRLNALCPSPSPSDNPGGGPSLLRQRRVSLGGQALVSLGGAAAATDTTTAPGRRPSVLASSASAAPSMRRPSTQLSMGLGLLDSADNQQRIRRPSVASVHSRIQSLVQKDPKDHGEDSDESSHNDSSDEE